MREPSLEQSAVVTAVRTADSSAPAHKQNASKYVNTKADIKTDIILEHISEDEVEDNL